MKMSQTDTASDPASLADLKMLIAMMRSAVSPILHAASDSEVARMQGVLVSATAMMGGMTVGHMLAVGVIDAREGHVDQFRDAVIANFDAGIEQGRKEALRAMLKMPVGGNA